MALNNNTVAFPVVATAGKARQHHASSDAEAVLVCLSSHRHKASEAVKDTAVVQTAQDLTLGDV